MYLTTDKASSGSAERKAEISLRTFVMSGSFCKRIFSEFAVVSLYAVIVES